MLVGATGERKHATVMFADVVGSTQLIADLSAESAMERLQPAVIEMCNAVRRFGGTVVRTLGDGVMAMFGAPRALEGHALLACEAALLMQSIFRKRSDGLAIRVGLHSGEVVASTIHSESLDELGAYGAAIHVANRLQALAEPGTICMTADCYHLVQSQYAVRALGRRIVKGFPDPIELYGLEGRLSPIASGGQAKGRVRLRGRDPEMNALKAALRDAEQGAAPVICLIGSPGIGKSRLCQEFASYCQLQGVPVRDVRAKIHAHSTPFQSALDILRALFGITPLDDAAQTRSRIAKRLQEVAPGFDMDLAIVAEFLGVADPQGESPAVTPKVRHARLLEIVRQIVRHDGASPSVIFVEDLHWVDGASQDFLAALADAVHGTRTLLVISARPGFEASFVPPSNLRELALRDLAATETEALVRELLGKDPSLREIQRRVVQRSAGNPFFAQELVRSLAENGLIVGTPGAYVRGPGEGEAALPATAEAVIGARLDRLGDVEKATTQLAAVIGQEVLIAVLAELARLPAPRLDAVLVALSRAEVVRERPEAEVPTCTFCHPLIQEVAYGTLLAGQRRSLHAIVARAMERFYRDCSGEFAALIGYHYEAAGHPVRAAEHIARAAHWVGATNPAEAIKHWHRVRSLLRDEAGTEEADRLRIMANGQIAWLGWREGMTAEAARPFIEEAVVAARRIDPPMVPMLLFVEGRIILASGGPADSYVQRVREALSLVDRGANLSRTATLTTALCHALGWAGLLEEALARNDEAEELLARAETTDNAFLGYDARHWSQSLRGRVLLRLGRVDEARASFDAMLAESDAMDPTVHFIPHFGYLELASHLDDLAMAEFHAAEVEALAARHGSAYLRVFASVGRAIVHGMKGDRAPAIEAFQSGLDLIRNASVVMEAEPDILVHLADCHLRNGAFREADKVAREAITLARYRSARVAECRASIICGAALHGYDDAPRRAQAEGFFQRALELIEVSGARLYAPVLEREFPAARRRLLAG